MMTIRAWACVRACVRTSVLTVAVFLVVLAVLPRLAAFSTTSSSECSVRVSDWSEPCWEDASSARELAARERAAGLRCSVVIR